MKLNFQMNVGAFTYQLAQLYCTEARGWYIMYKALSPYTGKLERRYIRMNAIRARSEDEASFRKYANDLVTAINLRLRNGESPYLSAKSARDLESVNTMFEKFLCDKFRHVRPDTQRSYRSHSNNFLKWLNRTAKNCLCSEFNPCMAVRYTEYLKSRSPQINARTYNGSIKFCRSVFKWGMKHFYCQRNPFENIELMSKEEKYRDVISPAQRQMIREYYQKRCPGFLVVVELIFNSFIRPREISLIQVKNVDLAQKVIHLYPEQTKTHAYRAAILSPELVEILTAELANNYPEDYFLISDDFRPGPVHLTTRSYNKSWLAMRRRLHLPDTLQLYSLRDSGIMELLDTELSPREVSEVIGHRDLKSINHYLHHHTLTMVAKMQRNTPRF